MRSDGDGDDASRLTTTAMFNDDDVLRQALLSPSIETMIRTPVRSSRSVNEASSSSRADADDDAEPDSDMETSYFAHLRNLTREHHHDDDDDEDDDDDIVQEQPPDLLDHYVAWLQRYYLLILLLTVFVLWPCGVHSWQLLQQRTDSTFTPVVNTPSALADDAFRSLYSHDMSNPLNPPLLVVLESKNSKNSKNGSSSSSSSSLIEPNSMAAVAAQLWCNHLTQQLLRNDSSSSNDDTQPQLDMVSYYSLHAAHLDYLAQTMTTRNGTMVLLRVQYGSNNTTHQGRSDRERVYQLMDIMEDMAENNSSEYFTVRYTGLMWFQRDLMQAAQDDLHRMDMALPLALLAMGWVLYGRGAAFQTVWIVPVVSLLSTVSLWSILAAMVAQHRQITQFTPTVMMSLTLGIAMDYTLFLLARFLESSSSMRITLRDAGKVVLASGLTLLFTVLGLTLLPLVMLRSVGMGAALAISSALVVNLTIVPALLSSPVGRWIVRRRTTSQNEDATSMDSSSMQQEALETPLISRSSRTSTSPNRRRSDSQSVPTLPATFWYKLSTHLLHPYRGIIILLVVFQMLMLVGQFAAQIKSSIAFELVLPSNSPALQTYRDLGQAMGWGSLTPYRILFDARNASNMTITSAGGFEVMHTVIHEFMALDAAIFGGAHNTVQTAANSLSHEPPSLEQSDGMSFGHDWMTAKVTVDTSTPQTSYSGIAVLENRLIPHSVFVSAKYCEMVGPFCPFDLFRTLCLIDQVATTEELDASFVTATLGVNPFSDQGIVWLELAREKLQQLEASGELKGVRVFLQGAAAMEYDAYRAVYDAFPLMIAITTAVIIAFMGVFFRSVFFPIRSVVSIGVTLAFSFGLGVLVYQDGILSWTNAGPLTSVEGEFCWMVPIMAFSLIVGLALDYDVFLVSRIVEFRLEGYDHKSSIAAAMDATGGIITAAGLIMTLAFGSLMFSSSPLLCQWSFLITTAVLLDTFVVRTVIVPTVTSLAGSRCSWWPRSLPEPRISLPAIEGGVDDVSSLLRSLEHSSEYEPILRNLRLT